MQKAFTRANFLVIEVALRNNIDAIHPGVYFFL